MRGAGLCLVAMLVLAQGRSSLFGESPANATTEADSAPPSTPSSALTSGSASTAASDLAAESTSGSGSPPRCRTFFAHGNAAGKDGVEYSTVLLWREHAVLEGGPSRGTWTLAVNVTATEGARIMLGSAARALPGQPHYEVVLGSTANASRLRAHQAPLPLPSASKLRLFEEGELQVWIRWRVEDAREKATPVKAGAATTSGLLEVSVLPAGRTTPTLLFSYNTSKPIQLETFSFGSTISGDVAFTVCTAERPLGSTPAATNVTEHHHGGALGVPGCRSLLVHVQSSHTNVHNLAVGWSETADRHGRLQFWARASTDVEVVVAERLHLRRGEPKYHVVFGGDFNSRTWALNQLWGRTAVTDSPALLSDFQYRPLWLAVSPRAVLTAGSGELHHGANHTGSAKARTLLSWTHPRGPKPKFVSFATYRQRQVHILIDCAKPPSQQGAASASSSRQPFPSDLRDVVRNSVASSLVSPQSASDHPALQLDVERLALHNGTLSASGTLVQELRHTGGLKWNPGWFDGVQKIQLWPTDVEGFEGGREVPKPTVVAVGFRGGAESKAKLETGPIEVNAERKIRWNFPIHLKMPCSEDKVQHTVSCSITFQLNSRSRSVDCHTKSSVDFDHKWKTECTILPLNETNNSIITFKVTSINHRPLSQIETSAVPSLYPQQRRHAGLLNNMYIILTITALITVMFGNKQLTSHRYSQYILKQISVWPKKIGKWPGKDMEDKKLIVGFEGDTVHMIQVGSENSLTENHENQETARISKKQQSEPKQKGSTSQHMLLVAALLLLSLFLSILDLIIR